MEHAFLSIPPADIAVVGAGAAGLLTSIASAGEANSQLEITLFDSRQKIGAKILISGGTRCNVTNREVRPFDYHGGPAHFVGHVLEAFTPAQTIDFFKEIGVPLVLEPSGKYFPETHSGRTVLDALVKETRRTGVKLETGVRVTAIKKAGDFFELRGESSGELKLPVRARRVVLCTGGLSYPETGSDGAGLRIAREFGHTVKKTAPALTPLVTSDPDWVTLAGVTLETRLALFKRGKKEASARGSFLFTHGGYSGPPALDLSRHVAFASKEDEAAIEANFLPSETEGSFFQKLERCAKERPRAQMKNILSGDFLLPARFVDVFLAKCGADGAWPIGRCRARELRKLAHRLLHCPLPVSGVVGYKKAEVTAGGVDLREVKVSTLESKIVPGLYFAGEILDVDGRIGGFNFQWAWSTGMIAGRSAATGLLKG